MDFDGGVKAFVASGDAAGRKDVGRVEAVDVGGPDPEAQVVGIAEAAKGGDFPLAAGVVAAIDVVVVVGLVRPVATPKSCFEVLAEAISGIRGEDEAEVVDVVDDERSILVCALGSVAVVISLEALLL